MGLAKKSSHHCTTNKLLFMFRTKLLHILGFSEAGTLLHWINTISVVLTRYQDATCMEGLCTGGKENIQLASKPQGCLQKKKKKWECSAWGFAPSTYLLALSCNTYNNHRISNFPYHTCLLWHNCVLGVSQYSQLGIHRQRRR